MSFRDTLGEPVTLIARLRLDAALYAPAPPVSRVRTAVHR